jgi:hypothetical protein
MGNSEGPGTPAWSSLAGTWGIIGNKAYVSAGTGDSFAVVTSPLVVDGYVQADITLSPTTNRATVGLVFRAADLNNMLLIEIVKNGVDDAIKLWKRVTGTWTNLASLTGAGLVNGTTYTFKVEFFGGQVYVYQNGILKLSWLLAAGEITAFGGATNNKYGLRENFGAGADDGGSRFDNFVTMLPETQTITLQRSIDGGVTWRTVTGASAYNLTDPQQQATIYDYEVPSLVTPQYRVFANAAEASV